MIVIILQEEYGYSPPDIEVGDGFEADSIGYHLRIGKHYFSCEKWLKFIRFVDRHKD